MSTKVEDNEDREFTTYGSIGVAIFFIFVGLVYLIPNTFPEGTLYIIAGGLILIVSILNSFKGMAYDWFNMLFAIVCIVIGSNKMLNLEIKFLPVMFIVIGVVALFANIKKLR
jgi:hypothetical protein